MDRHAHEQAYLLFLYNPIPLYAVNRAVRLVPYATTWTRLADTSVDGPALVAAQGKQQEMRPERG